jgi:hypothetical protein
MSSAIKDGAFCTDRGLHRSSARRIRSLATTIPQRDSGQTSLIPTVGIDIVVVCALDVDEALVYSD